MFRQNSSVKTKIIMMFSLVIIISIVVIAWLMGGIMHDKVIKAAQEKLESDLAMTKLVLDYKYPGDWQIINDEIYKGEVLLNNNFDLVDLIGELTGDTVTVFQGDTRVTTNVITDTGERATGTQVSDNVAKVTLIEKSQYVGEAEVVGVINQTVYEPIKDKDGTVIGILYVGVPNTPYDKMASEFKTKTYIFGLVFIVAACLIGWYFSRRLCRNIINIKKAADRVAQGDLNVNIDINSHDEIGALAWSLNNMTNNLNEVMTNINSAAEQVSAGSRQVSDSSLTLSQGATEQASSIEELTSSIEQIFAQTKQNANNATEASELAEKTKLNAEKGNQQMADMLKSMEEINNASSNISKIIKVIDDIAFQTNILSLNAAVEAAHAGQHGKGFAVVAEEVRNLAVRSADAAKETTYMIESSVKKVEDGSKLANETAVALSRIVEDVAGAAKLVNDIAIASNEQTMGINQINQGIMQVSEVVQNNTATAEEGASSSEELFSQADILKQQVNSFKLKKNFN